MQPTETPAGHVEHGAVAEPQAVHGDEFMVLVVGFTIGFMIAFGFLIYIVLASAGLLK